MTKDQEQIAESIISQIISEAVWRSVDGVIVRPFNESAKTYFRKGDALRENKRIVVRNNTLPLIIECIKRKAGLEVDNCAARQAGSFEAKVSNEIIVINIITNIGEDGEQVEIAIQYPHGIRNRMSVLKSGLASL